MIDASEKLGKLTSWKCCQRQRQAAIAVCSVIDENGNLVAF
jgi:hypothetical protein